MGVTAIYSFHINQFHAFYLLSCTDAVASLAMRCEQLAFAENPQSLFTFSGTQVYFIFFHWIWCTLDPLASRLASRKRDILNASLKSYLPVTMYAKKSESLAPKFMLLFTGQEVGRHENNGWGLEEKLRTVVRSGKSWTGYERAISQSCLTQDCRFECDYAVIKP